MQVKMICLYSYLLGHMGKICFCKNQVLRLGGAHVWWGRGSLLILFSALTLRCLSVSQLLSRSLHSPSFASPSSEWQGSFCGFLSVLACSAWYQSVGGELGGVSLFTLSHPLASLGYLAWSGLNPLS